VLRVHADDAPHARRKLLDDRAIAGLDRAHELRLVEGSTVGERRVSERELQTVTVVAP
jgi:hypothetical protein